LTYSVHAASTVLACVVERLRSRRKILDEIDASTLRLLKSCAACACARRSARCLGLPVVHDGPTRRRHVTNPSRRQRMSADR
jgi:hypothetical protein